MYIRLLLIGMYEENNKSIFFASLCSVRVFLAWPNHFTGVWITSETVSMLLPTRNLWQAEKKHRRFRSFDQLNLNYIIQHVFVNWEYQHRQCMGRGTQCRTKRNKNTHEQHERVEQQATNKQNSRRCWFNAAAEIVFAWRSNPNYMCIYTCDEAKATGRLQQV